MFKIVLVQDHAVFGPIESVLGTFKHRKLAEIFMQAVVERRNVNEDIYLISSRNAGA